MIRRLTKLNIFSINYIISEHIFSPTDKAPEPVFLYFIVVVHIRPTACASWNLINVSFHWVHVVTDRRCEDTDGHSETRVQSGVVGQMGIAKLVGRGVGLGVFAVFLKLFLEFCLLLGHLGRLGYKLRTSWALMVMGLLLALLNT